MNSHTVDKAVENNAMVYFDNTPHADLTITAVDSKLWTERIKDMQIATCSVCGRRLRNELDTTCERCNGER